MAAKKVEVDMMTAAAEVLAPTDLDPLPGEHPRPGATTRTARGMSRETPTEAETTTDRLDETSRTTTDEDDRPRLDADRPAATARRAPGAPGTETGCEARARREELHTPARTRRRGTPGMTRRVARAPAQIDPTA